MNMPGDLAGVPRPTEILLTDIDEFNAAPSVWDIECRQLDKRPLEARLARYATPNLFVGRAGFNQAIHQHGAAPSGMRTFAFEESGISRLHWCGQVVGPCSLLSFPDNNEYESLTPARFSVCTVSVNAERLAAVANAMGCPDALGSHGCGEVAKVAKPGQLRAFGELLCSSFAWVRDGGIIDGAPGAVRQLESEIIEELVLLLASRCSRRPIAPPCGQSRALRQAIAYIFAHARESITVAQVCTAAGVSWRTLNRVFRNQLGVTPKTCIKAARLYGVRRALLKESSASGRVSAIAGQWGFWHLGDFARDYRKQFGELPSQTLAGAAGSPADTTR
jgi:AraC family ethanolamine operon transcriptional activator